MLEFSALVYLLEHSEEHSFNTFHLIDGILQHNTLHLSLKT